MGYIEVKKIKGKRYLYYVHSNGGGKRKYKYIGPLSELPNNGLACPRCGRRLSESNIEEAILNRLIKIKDGMIAENEHISDYARFAIIEELIRAFSDSLSLD